MSFFHQMFAGFVAASGVLGPLALVGFAALVVGVAGESQKISVGGVTVPLQAVQGWRRILVGALGIAALVTTLIFSYASGTPAAAPTPVRPLAQTPPPATPTATPTPSPLGFSLDRTYQYHRMIGHSRTTANTNDDVTVTLMYLQTSTSDGPSHLQIIFDDQDASKGADFLFKDRSNVYMVDNHGVRYQALSAAPDEVIVKPRLSSSVVLSFPLVHAGASTLALNVNTDHGALETQCTLLGPDGGATVCPG